MIILARDMACELSLAELTPLFITADNSDRLLEEFFPLQHSLLSVYSPLGFTKCLVLDTLEF